MLFSACGRKTNYSKEEFVKYVLTENSGLKNIKIMNGIKYTLQYLPTKFMVITDNKNIKSDSIEYLEKKYSGLEYAKLIIENENTSKKDAFSFLKSPSKYNQFLQYTNTMFNQNISLEVDKISYPCVMSYAETGYKINSRVVFIVGFNKPKTTDDFIVSLKDEMFGGGIIKFLIEKSELENLQTIKII